MKKGERGWKEGEARESFFASKVRRDGTLRDRKRQRFFAMAGAAGLGRRASGGRTGFTVA